MVERVSVLEAFIGETAEERPNATSVNSVKELIFPAKMKMIEAVLAMRLLNWAERWA